jgi:hypothetical protein
MGDINGNIANKIPYRGHDIQRNKECAPKGKAFSLKLIHHYHVFALKKHLQHLQIAYGRVSSCADPKHSEITKCSATASLNTVNMKYTTTKID